MHELMSRGYTSKCYLQVVPPDQPECVGTCMSSMAFGLASEVLSRNFAAEATAATKTKNRELSTGTTSYEFESDLRGWGGLPKTSLNHFLRRRVRWGALWQLDHEAVRQGGEARGSWCSRSRACETVPTSSMWS